MKEEWQTIEEVPVYSVSNYGRVMNTRSGRILKLSINPNGYEVVSLSMYNKVFPRKVHRLVGRAFCPGYVEGLDINHLDGNKLNNAAWNLEWTTRRENIQHALRTGLSSGRRRAVRVIETGEVFSSQTECARSIGGFQSAINAVLRGKIATHRNLTFEYVD